VKRHARDAPRESKSRSLATARKKRDRARDDKRKEKRQKRTVAVKPRLLKMGKTEEGSFAGAQDDGEKSNSPGEAVLLVNLNEKIP
jgi:hypothetical protein